MSFDIQPIAAEDLPALVPLAEQFFNEGKLPGEFSAEVFLRSWSVLLNSGMCHILAARDGAAVAGAIGFTLCADLNTSLINAQELFWFVSPEQRRGTVAFRLLREYEDRAKAMGANSVTMAHIQGHNESLGSLYQRRGYAKSEILYRKAI